ncbi:hypothetical protein RF11_07115 [Thelohanellus kitauei]|uniref:Uncharacterized protein n=1 Tax=Thelohanellus kitauei TaxID=669202 RepID=A0A0C2MPZ8_THEKT|nr:hypothetical protein RF11_07115 [Thelohanellus kitauei]
MKLNKSVSAFWDAGHVAFFKAQHHPFNKEHFCGHFMVSFERFFSSGIHECIFIIDKVKERRQVNIPSTLLAFLYRIENLLPKWKNIVKPASPRSETDLFTGYCNSVFPSLQFYISYFEILNYFPVALFKTME